MKRTTVSLPDDLAAAVARTADRRRVSVSQVAREALAAHLGLAGSGSRALPFASLGSSGYRSTARDLEDLLAAEWDRDRGR
ncbi:MAG TPA: CopG family transcriptional regulator [Gaiellaceae bacterium]|nr:CopG family transcriptional regulator [Gaiellaceae bacterium]